MPLVPGDNDQGIKDKLAEGAKAANEAQQERVGTTDHHRANPGPVVTDKLPEPASREETEKRMKELNQK